MLACDISYHITADGMPLNPSLAICTDGSRRVFHGNSCRVVRQGVISRLETNTYTVFPVNILEPAQLARNRDGQAAGDTPLDVTLVHIL